MCPVTLPFNLKFGSSELDRLSFSEPLGITHVRQDFMSVLSKWGTSSMLVASKRYKESKAIWILP